MRTGIFLNYAGGFLEAVDEVGDRRPFGSCDGQVGAGAEYPRIGAGQQDRDAGLGGQRVGHRAQQAHVERVAPLRPGQAHAAEASRTGLDGQVRMRHAQAPNHEGFPTPEIRYIK